MELNLLTAISPIDGRYRKQCEKLAEYFSESALIKYRKCDGERIEHFIRVLRTLRLLLPAIKKFPKKNRFKAIQEKFASRLTLKDAQEIKDIEKITNHDAKAVEYFIKKKI